MKKNHNLPILLTVIALVAVVAQWNRHAGEKPEWTALRQDLAASLVRLWDQPDQRVELLPGHSGVVVQAQVSMPPATRPRQQRWNYAFLRFVAQRHPSINVEQLAVSDAASHQKISEIALNSLLAEAAYSPREDEENTCVLVGRQITARLEELIGRGEALVLVDARRSSSQHDDGVRYGRLVRQERPTVEALHYEYCIVSRRPIPDDRWMRASVFFGNGNYRKVTLP